MDGRPYSETRAAIQDGDGLFFRPISPDGVGICVAGRSEFSHFAKAAWWGGYLFALEMNGWYGGRAILLSNYVKQRPGGIVWFKIRAEDHPEFSRKRCVDAMKSLMGAPYGWWDIALTSLYHMAAIRFVRYLVKGPPPRDNEEPNGKPFYCSGAGSYADCVGGHDPVPELGNHWVMPGDLARSDFYQRQWALLDG